MNEVGARPGPEHHIRTPQVDRHLVLLEHGAVGDMAGPPRLAVADDALADLRPHAVAPDERAALNALTGREHDRDTVVMFLVALDGALRLQRDEIVALARPQQRGMNVGAMRHRVGMLEAALEAFVLQRHVDDRVARERAAHLHCRRPMGIGEHGILEPDLVKRPENIGAELDAGADLPKLRGLLEDADRKAATGERIAGRQPADAPASNENGLPAAVFTPVQVPRSRALWAV